MLLRGSFSPIVMFQNNSEWTKNCLKVKAIDQFLRYGAEFNDYDLGTYY